MTKVNTRVLKPNIKMIMENATNKEYWKRKWVIFDYDNVRLELRLFRIDIPSNQVLIEMSALNSNNNLKFDYEFIVLPLDRYNYSAFKNKIIRRAHDVVNTIEYRMAKESPEYHKLKEEDRELVDEHNEALEHYLDENNVTDEDIRSAYISLNSITTMGAPGEYLDSRMGEVLPHIHQMIDNTIDIEGDESENI